MKEIRLVVTEKRLFVSGAQSKLMAQFENFGQSHFQFHDSRNTQNTILPQKYLSFDWELDGDIRPLDIDKFKIDCSDESKM